MRINEFFYWLQGYFEISGTTAALTRDQLTMITRHLDLVDVGKGGSPDAARIGKIRAIVEFVFDESMAAEAATLKIRVEVSEQFVHVIDPAAGPLSTQARLNAAHGPSNGVTMRC